MLKIKTNKNNCILSYQDLSAVILSSGSSYDDEITVYAKNHCLLSNDTVVFNRKDGDTISFWAEKPVNTVIDKNTFTVDNFPPYLLLPSGYELVNIRNPFVGGISYNTYLRLYFDEGREHIYTTNKDDIKISGRYISVSGETEYVYSGKIKLCPDDYLLYDDVYLVKYGASYISNINDVVITASHTDGTVYILSGCIIGVNAYGNDNRNSIYIPYDSFENCEFIERVVGEEEFYSNIMFTGPDVRFLYGESPMEFGLNLKPGTLVEKIRGDIEVDFGIGHNFAVDLLHEKQIKDHVEKVANESINKIIDYERQQFSPMYYTGVIPESNSETEEEYLQRHCHEIDEKLKPVNEIRFNLCFREKETTIFEDENGNEELDFGTWETIDNGYWNNYKLSDSLEYLVPVYENKLVYGDLLGYLGFTDDDVRYQKDALKHSFLRLSFYDSPNRETQKLLYYSTIYFDTNELAKKYVNNLNAWRDKKPNYRPPYGQLVLDGDVRNKFGTPALPLCSEVFCRDKYDDTASSDGFYLYLFDKLVSGNTITPIYMKAEFNNAKYGRVIPMTYPVDEYGTKIVATSPSFPRDYVETKSTDKGSTTWVDINSLLKNMYIKVYIKYNYKTNNFVWFFAKNGKPNMKFELFEPRLNGYDSEAYFISEGGIVGYGTENGLPNWWNGGTFDNDGTWRDENGMSEQDWANNNNFPVLKTVAGTLQNESLIKGTKIFNENALPNIEKIYIDGIAINSSNYYDSDRHMYVTDRFQLPDIPFTVGNYDWEPETTQEVWDSLNDSWYIDTKVKPKIIHRVNYYFKNNTVDETNLIDELSEGIYNKKKHTRTTKTIETTSDVSISIKNAIPTLSTSYTIPKAMFADINSLRSVKFVKNTTNNTFLTVAGSGAFNNCQGLSKVETEPGAMSIISKNCFSGCRSLKTVDLSDTVAILREAFQGCYTLTIVNFNMNSPKTKYLGCASFGYTNIKNFELPRSVIRIGNSTFRRCYHLKNFTLQENSALETIGKRAFCDTAILTYNLNLIDSHTYDYEYIGGTPNVLIQLINEGVLAKFYDASSERHVTINLSTTRDSLQMFNHFLHTNYKKYLNDIIISSNSNAVKSFAYWYKNIFK